MNEQTHETIGTHDLSAWAVEEGVCWVQSRTPAIARQIPKLVECRVVARGCGGAYLLTHEVKRTLSWVRRNIVEKIVPQIPKKSEGVESGIGAGAILGGDLPKSVVPSYQNAL